MKKLVLLGFLILGISGCQNTAIQTPISPIAQSSSASPTSIPPTITYLPPIATPEPIVLTSTAIPPLQSGGPYLTYFKQIGQNWFLVLADADGVGRKLIALPAGLSKYDLPQANFSPDHKKLLLLIAGTPTENEAVGVENAGWYLVNLPEGDRHFLNKVDGCKYESCFEPSFSPDGQWLVFYTPNNLQPSATDKPAATPQVTLNLMKLSSGKIVHHINLLPYDYPKNFEKLLATIPVNAGIDIPSLSSLQESFLQGLDSVDWSPNGNYMAFAGAMDGPSSDLYVYNMQTSAIQRLSDGSKNIQWINWSADGKEIFQASSYYDACEGDCNSYYTVALDGKPARAMTHLDNNGGVNISVGWLTPSRELMYSDANGSGEAYLRYFDYELNQTVDLYPFALDSVALDPDSKMLLVLSSYENVPNTPIGIHLINPWNRSQKDLQMDICNFPKDHPSSGSVNAVMLGVYRFAVACADGTELVALDGSVAKLSDRTLNVTKIPNREQLIGFDKETSEAIIYSADLKAVRQVMIHPYEQMAWRPDGQGAFYWFDDKLYYWEFSSNEEVLVDDGVGKVDGWIFEK